MIDRGTTSPEITKFPPGAGRGDTIKTSVLDDIRMVGDHSHKSTIYELLLLGLLKSLSTYPFLT